MKLKRVAAISALTFMLATGAAKAKTPEMSSIASKIDTSSLSKALPVDDGDNNSDNASSPEENNNTPNPSSPEENNIRPNPSIPGQGAPTIRFPVQGTRKDQVVNKGYMETWFDLDSNGNLNAKTRTWTDVRLKGFTGGVLIAFTDASGAVIWSTEQQRYGVDGTWVGNSNRTENWQAKVPPDTLSRIGGYAILQEYTPRSRVFEWIQSSEAQAIIKAIVNFFRKN